MAETDTAEAVSAASHEHGDYPGQEPNCVGYAVFSLGMTPSEVYVSPDRVKVSPEGVEVCLKGLAPRRFDRVEGPDQADIVASVFDLNATRRDGPAPNLHLTHMAVLDKKDPGYVSQRTRYGADVERHISIKDAFGSVLGPRPSGIVGELWYLRARDAQAAE